jgi:hypothetical protein
MKLKSRGRIYLLIGIVLCALAVMYGISMQQNESAAVLGTKGSIELTDRALTPPALVVSSAASQQMHSSGSDASSGRALTYGEARDLAAKLPSIRAKFPHGLGSLVNKPAHDIDAVLAYEASNLLRRCDTVNFELELKRASVAAARDLSVKAVLSSLLEDDQWLQAECRDLASGASASRIELLRIAVKGGVKGAAADLYVLEQNNSVLLPQVLEDARRGEWLSLAVIASRAAGSVVGDEDVKIARATLNEALKDAALQQPAEAYSAMAFRLLDTQGIKTAQDQKSALDKAIAAGQAARTFPAQTLNGGQQEQVAGILALIRSSKS